MIRQYHEQYQWFLGIAILLLLAEMLLPERKKAKGQTTGVRRTYAFADVPVEPAEPTAAKPPPLPPPIPPVIPPPIPTVTVVALIAFLLLPLAASASPASAMRDYNSGNYTNALDEFTRQAEIQTNDLRLVFNAGDAAYRATNFDLAQGLFGQVTLSPDINLQQKAFYNLGNAQFQLAKQATDLDGIESGLEIAGKSYGRALDLNTNDADAAFNLSFTKDAVERIKEFRAMLLRAKSEADHDVQIAEFHEALTIMAPLQAKLQKTIVAKQYEDFTKKLKQIDDIANPQSPGSIGSPSPTGLPPNP
jgi:Ca-activated chloride channel family protein